jgi:periplasmic divalent cation tolerance protein
VSAPTAPDVAAVVLSTVPDAQVAERVARALVEERLAACVSRVPGVGSLYRWQGEIEEAEEVLLVIKTHARRAPELTRRLRELHPYEVPEILVLPVAAGLSSYLDWVREETRPAEETA